MTEVLLAAALIAATSFSGALFSASFLQKRFARWQAMLVSFAAGVFVIAGSVLIFESLEIMSWQNTLMFGGASLVVFHLLSVLWPEHHYHSEAGHCDECGKKGNVAKRMLVGDSIHNIVDGMLLVSAFLVDAQFGFLAVLAIWLHEVVQEISEFVVYKNAGYSTKRALSLNGLSALTIFVGVGIAFAANELIHDLEGPLLAIAGGAFLYIALRDLIPHSVEHSRAHKKYHGHIIAFVLGVLLMWLTGQIAPHSHGEGEHDSHEHEEELVEDDHLEASDDPSLYDDHADHDH